MFLHRFLLITLFLLLPGFAVLAQQETGSLSGIITDKATKQPIGQVSVKILNSKVGTVSEEDGTFSLKIPGVPGDITLVFSHLAYKPLKLKLKPGQHNIPVVMEPKVTVLEEVEVATRKLLKPEKVNAGSVLDYEVLGDKVLLLGWQAENKNPVLKMLAGSSDSVLKVFKLPFYTKYLYRDCLDNLHLLTETRAFEVKLDSVSLGLYPPRGPAEFNAQIKPCVAALGSDFYLEQPFGTGISKAVYYAQMPANKSKLLCILQDEEILAMQEDEERHQQNRGMAGMNRTASSAAHSEEFAQRILFQPPYIPLFRIGKKVAIFNHVKANISFYQRESLTQTVPITYQQRKDWGKEIIIDPVQQQAYGKFNKNGITFLEEINLETGQTGKAYKIALPFARKFRIWNGRVYFIYRDINQQSRDFLFAARLEDL